MELERLKLENRINLLSERTNKENGSIVRKLKRKLRKLNESSTVSSEKE